MKSAEQRGLTPSQTVGPYFSIALDWPGAERLIERGSGAQTIVIEGHVYDGDGRAVNDALVEIWQADAEGHYRDQIAAPFRGAGRAATDGDGRFAFETIKPGAVVEGDIVQAPHINLCLFARGLLVHLYSRIYFADETAANAADAVLRSVPAARRNTLMAVRRGESYVLDLHLQGDRETVFFDV